MEVKPPPAQRIVAMSPEEFFKNTVPCDCSVHHGDYRDCESDFRFKVAGLIEWARDEMVKEVAIEKHKEMEEMLGVYSAVGDTSVRIGDCSDTLTRLAEDIIKE